MLSYILFVAGLGLLIKGADWLVDGSVSVAKRFQISELVIGLTVVAFGTSAPELFVNLSASFQNTTDIAIGNIIGSNIANILLILGIAGIIYPLQVTRGTVWKEIPLSLLAAGLVLIMANDTLVDNLDFNILTRSDGLALIGFFIIFLYYIVGIAKTQPEPEPRDHRVYSGIKSGGMIALGLALLILGGQWMVNGAITIAQQLNLSEALIGLTIVAVGTSLPELATSLMAAYKKNPDIAVGNVVGSNIFNIFWILGISAVIRPLPFKSELNLDLSMAVVASLLLFAWMFIGQRHRLERWQGIALVLVYVGYLALLIVRG